MQNSLKINAIWYAMTPRIVIPSVILITLKKKSLNHGLYSFDSAKIYTDFAFLITQQGEK